MTDAQAIEAALRGERDAFSVLVQRYQRLVEAVAYGVTRNPALVDDVVQDTFVTAWRTLDRLRDPSSIRHWLTAIARNLARNARRRGRRDTTMPDAAGDQTPFDQLSDHERDRAIAAALAKLPARYREPIVLFYYEQCTVKEVADALALREQAVMQRLSRGRRRLGETLAARIEIGLENRKSRAALAACVVALLPTRSAGAATLAIAATTAATTAGAPLASAATAPATSATAATSSATAATTSATAATTSATTATSSATTATTSATAPATVAAVWWGSLVARLATYGRLGAGLVGVTAASLILLAAVSRSNAIAAKSQPPATQPQPPQPPQTQQPASPPKLPDEPARERLYRNIAVADLDAGVTCARGAAGVVISALGKDALHRRGDNYYYEPSPALQQTIDRVSARAADACGGGRWPEIYVLCEATLFDIMDGNVTCYPYDVFAEPLLPDEDEDEHVIVVLPTPPT